jgi:hypothetical protein
LNSIAGDQCEHIFPGYFATIDGKRQQVGRKNMPVPFTKKTPPDDIPVVFRQAFARLARVTTVASRLEPDTIRDYWALLATYPLGQLVAAADHLAQTERYFPSVHQWIEAVAHVPPPPPRPEDHRWMTASEMHDHATAAARGYQDDPCDCPACGAAGVSGKPLRFVPNDDGERAYNVQRRRLEAVGHWAHGAELARWYAARSTFFGQAQLSRYPAVRRLLERDRDPGEDD